MSHFPKGVRVPPPQDIIGEIIWDIKRILGIRYFSATQLAEKCGLNLQKSKSAIDYLIKTGFAIPYIAPKCLNCSYVWPEYEADEEIEEEIFCPVCNEFSDSQDATFYVVYKILSPPEED